MTRDLDATTFEAALAELGALLAEQNLRFEFCIIGGAAFVLHGFPEFIATADLDVAAQVGEDGALTAPVPLPIEVARAARVVGNAMGLGAHWINSAAAASFGVRLPPGFLERATRIEYGGLVLHIASRQDLMSLKLLAALRRGQPGERHRDDLRRANVTIDELQAAADWIRSNDTDSAAAEPRIRDVVAELVRHSND